MTFKDKCLLRSRTNKILRDFFDTRGFLEAETPLLSPSLIPESSIEIFSTSRLTGNRREPLYLVPSPEVWMKRILSKESSSLYQIGKCFRNSEQSGRIHSNEFTMLEWYAVGLDHRDNIDLTRELFSSLAPLASERDRSLFKTEFLILTMDEAFVRWAGFSLLAKNSAGDLRAELERLSLPFEEDDSRETLFNRIFLSLVEPELPVDRPVILTDYPSFIPTLARTEPDSPVSERWELYLRGIELANCYREETDPVRIARYFEEETRQKEKALVPHKTDASYPSLFHGGYPSVSGVALGVDRLLMTLSGAASIDEVLHFLL